MNTIFVFFRKIFLNLTLIFCLTIQIRQVYSRSEEVLGIEETNIERYQIVKFNFDHVSGIYIITLWILLGSLAKVCFHMSQRLSEKLPESCFLIILGLAVGALLYFTKLDEKKSYVLNADTFFLFLLPPIIFEAGYFMRNRPFFDNIGTILLFAIANTLFNTIAIGLTLWAFSFTPLYAGVEFEFLHCLVFAALISAVDPVAVLATFVEIQVNDMLYIIVFGESLLNDAVSVVLYRMFDAFAGMGAENVQVVDIVLGGTSFMVVSLGSVIIGILFGFIICFTAKFTEHTPILEPLIVLSFSYLSYLTAEMFSLSGILTITFCGLFTNQYIRFNICKESISTIEYVLKLLASIMETIIFIFMGISIVSDHYSWNIGFVVITLISCSLFRIIGVFIFANIANRWRLIELKLTDMLIMSYGGIRGAVAFALALILDESKIPRKKEFVTATIAVVFFTVFVQGSTIGPMVKYLKIKLKEDEDSTIPSKLGSALIDNLMSGLEIIAGYDGKYYLLNKIRYIDRKYINPFIQRKKVIARDERVFRKIEEILVKSSSRPSNINLLKEGNIDPRNRTDFMNLLEKNIIIPKRASLVHNRIQLEKNLNQALIKHQPIALHRNNPINIRNLINPNDNLENKNRNNPNFHPSLDQKQQLGTRSTLQPQNSDIQSPKIGVLIPPPWKSQECDNEEAIIAPKPTWANNNEYINHLTATQSFVKKHKHVSEVFENNE